MDEKKAYGHNISNGVFYKLHAADLESNRIPHTHTHTQLDEYFFFVSLFLYYCYYPIYEIP